MPRYFFNVKDKVDYIDETGVDLPDLASAKEEAIHHFGEVLQSYSNSFADGELWQLTVADQLGAALMTFSFFMHKAYNL